MAKSISDALEGIKFKRLEQFDCSKIVAFTSETDKWNHNLDIRKICLRIFAKFFIDRFKYVIKEEKGKKNILFAYNELYYIRKDVYQMMLNIYSCAENATFIQYERCKRPCGILSAMFRIYLVFTWYRQMYNAGLNLTQRLGVVNDLLEAQLKCERIKNFLDYKALVVRYDAYVDNPVSQFFKINGRLTITAQHGLMCATRNVPYYGIWFRAFVSDYFMAWDDMTKMEALKDGLKETEVVVCGNAKCIDSKPCIINKEHVMGILLDGYDFINKGLIDIANAFCDKHGYKYILRYHPNYKGDEYDKMVNKDYYIKTEKESLYEYANSVEFTLMGNSTALLELLYMQHPTYVFSTGADVEIYKGIIPVCYNLKDLELLLNNEDYLSQVKRTLVTIKDARKGYTDFFKMIDNSLNL